MKPKQQNALMDAVMRFREAGGRMGRANWLMNDVTRVRVAVLDEYTIWWGTVNLASIHGAVIQNDASLGNNVVELVDNLNGVRVTASIR